MEEIEDVKNPFEIIWPLEEDVRDIVPGENDLPRKVIFMSLTFVGNR